MLKPSQVVIALSYFCYKYWPDCVQRLKHASFLRKVVVSPHTAAQTNAWTGANFHRLILIMPVKMFGMISSVDDIPRITSTVAQRLASIFVSFRRTLEK